MADEKVTKAESVPKEESSYLYYNIKDIPPLPLCLLFIFQQVALAVSATLMVPVLITQIMGQGRQGDPEAQRELLSLRAQLISITVFACGVSTLMQCTFGIRLPLIQGSSYSFLAVVTTIVTADKYQIHNKEQAWIPVGNGTMERVIWKEQLQEISGSLMAASGVQVFLGVTGLMGFLARHIGPLTIAPILALIGLGFVDSAAINCSYHWGIAGLAAFLSVVFGEVLGKFKIPIPNWTRKDGFSTLKIPIFSILPVFLAIFITWGVCGFLTLTDALPSNKTAPAFQARTDSKAYLIGEAPWILMPYPGRWGWPSISAAGFIGMLAATLSSIVESVGDYHAASAICGAPSPPPHAINRGILFEGMGSFLSGLLFAGHGTTSYSTNIGSISLTRVGSRIVFQGAGVVLILMGIFGKVGAVLATLPEPVLGGVLLVLMSVLISVSMSLLKDVHMNKSRNQLVMGLALFVGVVVPRWARQHPDQFNTGIPSLDQIFRMLLGTEIILGGFLGFLLDSVLPGTREERGMASMHDTSLARTVEDIKEKSLEDSFFGCPICCPCARSSPCQYVPFMPNFRPDRLFRCRKGEKEFELIEQPPAVPV